MNNADDNNKFEFFKKLFENGIEGLEYHIMPVDIEFIKGPLGKIGDEDMAKIIKAIESATYFSEDIHAYDEAKKIEDIMKLHSEDIGPSYITPLGAFQLKDFQKDSHEPLHGSLHGKPINTNSKETECNNINKQLKKFKITHTLKNEDGSHANVVYNASLSKESRLVIWRTIVGITKMKNGLLAEDQDIMHAFGSFGKSSIKLNILLLQKIEMAQEDIVTLGKFLSTIKPVSVEWKHKELYAFKDGNEC